MASCGDSMKSHRGSAVKSQSRLFIKRLHDYFSKEKSNNGPLISVEKITQRVADALHISRKTVSNVINSPGLETPGKSRSRSKPITALDSFQEDAIRRHIYSYYTRKEFPTRAKLVTSLRESDLFHGGVSSLSKILDKLGFKWRKINNRKYLLERSDIVALRQEFLRLIREEDFNKIVFIDETWVNAGHTLKKSWSDDSVLSSRKEPTGKGGRIILAHGGMSTGFIENAMLLFRSKKIGDYHQEMNGDTFKEWFIHLLELIPPGSTIVLDNAPYHSVQIDKPPTSASTKKQISEWLISKNITYCENSKKGELVDILRRHKPLYKKKYEIDILAENMGHRVLRLPPYHFQYNPIELIWANVKNKVATNNKTFSLDEVERLTLEAVESISSEDWENAVRHTKTIIEEDWLKEGIIEVNVEEMLISLGGEDLNSTDDDMSDESSAANSEDDTLGVYPLP